MESEPPEPLPLSPDQVRELVHDLSNALTVLATHLSIVRATLPTHDRHHIDGAATACRLAVGLARQLTAAPRVPVDVRPIDAEAVVRRWAQLVEPLLGSGARVSVAIDSELPQIAATPYALDRVLSNLLTNAREALPDGGHLELRARARSGYVVISITDDGPGIPDDVRARLFEEGPSSKGQGRGLGLANAFRIVTDHGGTLDVETAPGCGTTLTIYWPCAEPA